MSDKKDAALRGWDTVVTIVLGVVLFLIIVLCGSGEYGLAKGAALGVSVVVLAVAAMTPKARWTACHSALFWAVGGYVLIAGASTFYAYAPKFGIAEFSSNLIGFALLLCIVLYAKRTEAGFRRLAALTAACGVPIGLLSVDAVSSNILMPLFRAVMRPFTSVYQESGTLWYSRLQTIFDNPNTYAGLMSVLCLLALYVCLTAHTRGEKIGASIVLTINSVCYLLAFSMGSLAFFAAACVLLLVLCPMEERIGCALLIAQTAIVALATGFGAAKGFGDTVTGSLLPLAVLAAGCVLSCALEVFVRTKLAVLLQNRGKMLLLLLLCMIGAATVYVCVGLHWTGAYTFGADSQLLRTADLTAGNYTLSIAATDAVQVRVYYKNENNLIQNNETELVSGNSAQPLEFIVPEDSELVFFALAGGQGTVIQRVAYEGASSGTVKLNYKLLPAFVADRIQDLSANGNVVQRTVYIRDALRLFRTAPVFGRGLGGFENGVFSVQNYYYQTKYAHNHYAELLCDLGIAGLAAFLAILCCAVTALVRRRKRNPLMMAVLSACLLQMFGQAVSDVTWSVGVCIPVFFIVLGLIAAYFGRANDQAESKGRGVAHITVTAFLAFFVVAIGGNLLAASRMSSNPTFQTAAFCAKIDPFEKNDYKMTYVQSSIGVDDPSIQKQAQNFAAQLRQEHSNAIAMILASYYYNAGDIDSAMDVIEQGTRYIKSDQMGWQRMFDLYQQMFDLNNESQASHSLAKRMLEDYQLYVTIRDAQMDNMTLSDENTAFIQKLEKIADTVPE